MAEDMLVARSAIAGRLVSQWIPANLPGETMHWLVYWKCFWRDNAEDDTVNEDWYTASASFFSRVQPGDSLWVVVNGGRESPDEWRLLQRIVPTRKRHRPGDDRPYHITGDPAKGQYFDVASQRDATPLLHKLTFESGKPIRSSGRRIGQSLQMVRPLTNSDGHLFEQYCRKLQVQQ